MTEFGRIAVLIVVSSLSACQGQQVRIPNGTYASGAETIQVDESSIRFKIKLDDQTSNALVDQTFNYQVLPNGRLSPYPMASQEVLTGIGRFDWKWDGEKIIQAYAQNGRVHQKIFKKLE